MPFSEGSGSIYYVSGIIYYIDTLKLQIISICVISISSLMIIVLKAIEGIILAKHFLNVLIITRYIINISASSHSTRLDGGSFSGNHLRSRLKVIAVTFCWIILKAELRRSDCADSVEQSIATVGLISEAMVS